MKTDPEIEKDVKEELSWDSRTNDCSIDLAVENGHVTLSGRVDSYPKKIYAEKAAMRVAGVAVVTNELEVKIPASSKKTDAEIKKAVTSVIKWNIAIDENRIKVRINDGWVTLEGEVEWEYQRTKARILAEDISGVVGVTNLINVVPESVISSEAREKIMAALKRNYYLDTSKINVKVENGKAIFTGQVRTIAEKYAVEAAGWSAPGIKDIVNELVVDCSEIFV